MQYPDGTFVIDYMEELIEHQKIFMEVVSDIRSTNMFTFPVLTYSLLYKNGKFVDEEFARWCSDHNTKWNDSNFFVSGDVSTLSNCCFEGSQKTLSKSSSGVNFMSFKELYQASYEKTKQNFTVFHNGSWTKGKIIRLPKSKLFKITTSNHKSIIVTDNHLNPTLRGDVRTDALTRDDYLLFNTSKLNSVNEVDKRLTYEQGFLIGMYAGDGSICSENSDAVTTTIALSLNNEKYTKSIDTINKACSQIGANSKFKLGKIHNNVFPLTIRDNIVRDFIRQYIKGSYCYEKELNMDCLLQSPEFRRGILDGYYLTDGGNSNRIYTTSEKMAECLEALITSLGLQSIIDVSDRTGEDCVEIRGSKYNRNFPVYCIRWYEECNRRCLNDVYIRKNNSMFFRIVSIEPFESEDDYVYCFEMKNSDEPYFTLPNGVITHNCRLLSDTSKLDAFINSIGGTALSIGSVKVNTINLMRIALESKYDKETYLSILRNKATLCCKALDAVRHIIARNVEKGLLPNYQDGGIEMSKQYSTVGM